MTVILLVEDEPAIAEPLSYLLEREGYEVAVAPDGGEALARFGRGDVDLVLLDLMLPVLTGTEVAKRIRTASDVPIEFLHISSTHRHLYIDHSCVYERRCRCFIAHLE